MALDVGTLVATLTIKDEGFASGVNNAKSQLQGVDTAAGKATKSTTTLGTAGSKAGSQLAQGAQAGAAQANVLTAALGKAKAAAGLLGIAFTAKAAVNFFTDAVQNSRKLGAQTNQLNVLFGENKAQIMDWAKTAKSELFISQRAAQDAAIQFATFGTVAGKSGSNLAKFSTEMTKLAVETASFGGTDVQEVIDAMGSAFQGQAIPMRKYGVLLSDTALREVALREKIIESNRVLSGREKVLATEIAMKEQLTAVNGDIERSHGQLGQNLKGLKARYEETSAAIGDKLKPIVNSFVQLLSGPGLDALGSSATVIGTLAKGVQALGSFFGGLPGPLQAALAGMVAAKLGATALGGAVGSAGSRVRGMSDTVRLHGMYAMDGLRNAFTTAAGSATRFGAVGRGLNGTWGVMKAGVGGLTSALGGGFGIAIMAATIGLGAWMQKTAQAKQAAKDMSTSAQSVAEELEKTGGKYSAQGEKAALAALDTVKLSDGTTTLKEALQDAGVPLEQAARGIAGMGDAAGRTRKQLEDMHRDERENLSGWAKRWQEFTGAFSGKHQERQYWNDKSGRWETDYDTKYSDALKQLDGLESKIKEKRKTVIAAMSGDSVAESFKLNADTHDLDVMTDAMETFADASAGAADKVKALSNALDSLNSDDLTLQDATQALNDAVRDLPDEYKTAKDEAAKAGKEFLDSSGHVNTFTKAGSKLHDTLKGTASGFGKVASSLYEIEFANGNYSGALDATRRKLQEQYDAHVNQQVALGRNREEYEALLTSYGATPEQIMTRLDIVNAEASKTLIAAFGDQVTGMPNEKTVTVKSLTDDARQELDKYGFTINALPDGKGFEVVANTKQAETLLTLLGGKVEGIPPRKDVVVEAPGSETVIGQLDRVGVLVRDDNGKDIVVTDNSTETMALLEKLNVRTKTLDDGRIWILDNASEVAAKVDRELQGKQTSGTHTVRVTTWTDSAGINVGHHYGTPAGKALGGPITGGVAGKDSVPIMAMPDEHMLTVDDVRRMGGHGAVYRFRAALAAGKVQGFANGGAIGGFGGSSASIPETANAVTWAQGKDTGVPLSAKKRGAGLAGAGEGLSRLGIGAVGGAHMLAALLGGGGLDTGSTSIPGMDSQAIEEWLRLRLAEAAGLEAANPDALTAEELQQLGREIEDGDAALERARNEVDQAKASLHKANTADKRDADAIRMAEIRVREAEADLREVERKNQRLAEKKAKAGDTPKADEKPEFKDWAKEQLFGAAPMSEPDRTKLRESIEDGVSAQEKADFAVEKAEAALAKAKNAKDPEAENIRAAELALDEANRRSQRLRDDNAALASKYATATAPQSGGAVGALQQQILEQLGIQQKPGQPISIHVGLVSNGTVQINDPEELLKPHFGGAPSNPIADAMRALGA